MMMMVVRGARYMMMLVVRPMPMRGAHADSAAITKVHDAEARSDVIFVFGRGIGNAHRRGAHRGNLLASRRHHHYGHLLGDGSHHRLLTIQSINASIDHGRAVTTGFDGRKRRAITQVRCCAYAMTR